MNLGPRPKRANTNFNPEEIVVEEGGDENVDWDKVDMKQYNEIKKRFNEYREAASFFIHVNCFP